MKKKTLKILTAIFIVCVLLVSFSSIVRASTTENLLGGIQNNSQNAATNQSQEIGGLIVGIVQTVGTIVAVVVVVVLGIKYMTGSTEEKAEYKKTMLPYFVGAIVLFLGVTIVRVIYSFATRVNNGVSTTEG